MDAAISSVGKTWPSGVSGASMHKSPSQKMANLFDTMDSSGTGAITKTQLEEAFQTQNPPPGFKAMGADAIFAKLDPNNTGSVSQADFVSGMTSLASTLRAQRQQGAFGTNQSATASSQQSLEASLQALNDLGGATPSPDTPKGSLVNALV